jgi:hypothetical protein
MRRLLILLGAGVVGIFIIIAGVSAISANQRTQREKKVATTFVNNVLANNAQGSYAMFSDTAQNIQGADDWAGQVEKVSSFFKGTSATYQTITTENSYQLATFTITGSDGKYLMKVQLEPGKTGPLVRAFTSELQAN